MVSIAIFSYWYESRTEEEPRLLFAALLSRFPRHITAASEQYPTCARIYHTLLKITCAYLCFCMCFTFIPPSMHFPCSRHSEIDSRHRNPYRIPTVSFFRLRPTPIPAARSPTRQKIPCCIYSVVSPAYDDCDNNPSD